MALRTRLTTYYTCFFAVALLLIGAGLYFAVRTMLERGVESEVRAGLDQVLNIYNQNPSRNLEFINTNDQLLVQLKGATAGAFVNPNLTAQVFSPAGKLLGSSSEKDPSIPLPPQALSMKPRQEIYIPQAMGSTRRQILVRPLVLQGTSSEVGVGFVLISRSLHDIDETLRVLLYTLLGGGAIALAAAAQGSAWLTKAALEPIDQITRTAQGIVSAADLGQRVPVPATQDEIQRLTVTVNDLLARLDVLFSAQRRFMADVSHELRTPLTAMQGNLEILARGASRDPELLDESMGDMRRETSRLIRMVNDLLLLAQSEAGVTLRQEPVELDTLLLEVHRELRPLAGGVNLRIGKEDQLAVVGDRDRLKQALLNLGINALQHTPSGGTVELNLEQRDNNAVLSVCDTGEGIPSEALPYLFERFYRADPARTRHNGGAGLGLAIVKWIVESHNGRVAVETVPGQGSIFSVWLPLAVAPTLVLPSSDAVGWELEASR